MKKLLLLPTLLLALMTSCVSKKKFLSMENELKKQKEVQTQLSENLEKAKRTTFESDRARTLTEAEVKVKAAELAAKEVKVKDLESQIEFLRANNEKLHQQVTNMTEANRTEASNINKLIEQTNELNKIIEKKLISKNY